MGGYKRAPNSVLRGLFPHGSHFAAQEIVSMRVAETSSRLPN
jgi:hypothetical protein